MNFSVRSEVRIVTVVWMSTTSPDMITCIYCKLERPPSREHVLPRSLGGDLVRLMLCMDCNSRRLSPLDQALGEHSVVGLMRAAKTPATAFDVKVGGEHFVRDPGTDLVLEVNLTNEWRVRLFPQVHLRKNGELSPIVAAKEDLARLEDFVSRSIAKGRLATTFWKPLTPGSGDLPRLVMHRSDDGFVRAESKEAAASFLKLLEEQWHTFAARISKAVESGEAHRAAHSIENPTVNASLEIRLNDVFRAVTKIAFNVLAVELGTQFALSSEFDELRQYVLGADIRSKPSRDDGELNVDSRFVTGLPFDTEPLVPTVEHVVTLFYNAPTLLAWVTLYGSCNYIVRLADIPLSQPVLSSREFSALRRGNEALSAMELARRLQSQKRSGDG